jgi:Tfp pilus assembly protein PilO
MNTTETGDRRASLKANLFQRLHDPVQLRICVMSAVLVAGYGAVYMPLSQRIAATSKKLERDKNLLELAGRLERLQKQHRTFEDRVPQQTDTKEWVHYVLEGIRAFPLKLSKLDCREPKQVGPYRAIVLQIELEGSFFELDRFLRWLESNHRLLRADDVKLAPGKGGVDTLSMRLTVLGLTG